MSDKDQGIDAEQLYAELKKEKREKQDALDKLEDSRKENQFLKDKNAVLERNISSLYTTAKIEMQRKDAEIKKLRDAVETRTLEIERREDLRKRATDCVHELHQRLGDLQSSSEIYRTGQYCEELLRDTISMIFDDSGNS
eukprot:gb/GECG01006738.1/.p1 GENE.gb/GECG01006738.1/~~gb/GECG01006738.1/.p1  ORF type:complete len:140 (+),score=32.34 gb/GECG01006738.1/:1-420(+)